MKRNKFPKGVMPQIVPDYYKIFASFQALQVTHKVASNKFLPIVRLFNNKWHPQQMKDAFHSVFSLDEWKALSEEEKATHTINSFPSPKRRGKKPIAIPKSTATIELSE